MTKVHVSFNDPRMYIDIDLFECMLTRYPYYVEWIFYRKIEQCQTSKIPILMHQMRISTNKVSSVMLSPKKLDIQKVWNL
jgi:hypothetical protein